MKSSFNQKWVMVVAGLVLISLTACTAILTGAVSPNKYGPSGTRGGYSQTQLSEDRYLVYFRGTWSKEERVADFAMLRTAELTVERGFSHFEVLSQSIYKEGVDRSQGAAIPIGPISISGSSQSDRLTSKLLIQMLHEPQDDAETVHDATSIRDEIAAKYEIR